MNLSSVMSMVVWGVYGITVIKNIKSTVDALLWAKRNFKKAKKTFYDSRGRRGRVKSSEKNCVSDEWTFVEEPGSAKHRELAVDREQEGDEHHEGEEDGHLENDVLARKRLANVPATP